MKLNELMKRLETPFTFIALFFTLLGFLGKLLNITWLNITGFVLSFCFAGLPIFIKALSALRLKIISIELLVTIASIAAMSIKEYSEAGVVTMLFMFGSFLEKKTLSKTRNAIKTLLNSAPKKAYLLTNDEIKEVDATSVKEKDKVVCKAGEMVPIDGMIIKGEGFFIESKITGESRPVHKTLNDFIYAGTVLDSGDVIVLCQKEYYDTTFSHILELVEEAEDEKMPIERFTDSFAKWYTPFVILISLISFLIKLLITKEPDIDMAITILVLACPGALVIGVPVASVAGIGRAAKSHILLKGGDSLKNFSQTDMIFFDKTGTLTNGNFLVNRVEALDDIKIFLEMEQSFSHPIAKSLIKYAHDNGYSLNSIEDVLMIKGKGLSYKEYLLGSQLLMEEREVEIPTSIKEVMDEAISNNQSFTLGAKGKKCVAIFVISDTLKLEAVEAIERLKKLHIKHFMMLTGDNQKSAEVVAKKLQIEYKASLLPSDKMNEIKKYNESYKTCFVGDGVNDAPSLISASTGVAMGSGSDSAMESASVVLMKSNLLDLVTALKIAKKTVLIGYENIIIALLTVIFLLVGLFMNFIHMSIGMLIHELSILVVILNGMRILLMKEEK